MSDAGVNVRSWTVRAPIIVLMRFTPGLLVLFFSTLANAQESQLCSVSRSEVTLGPLSGHRIDSVAVITSSPNLGRRGRALAKMHVRTRPEIIRRELLFAAGDTVDTLRVAESLRRLRKLQFLEDVRVEDYGIRGLHLAYELLSGYDRAILIDAVPRGGAPGTLYVVEPDPTKAAGTGDAHRMDLPSVFAFMRTLGGVAPPLLLVGCEPASIEEGMELSQAVSEAVEPAAAL